LRLAIVPFGSAISSLGLNLIDVVQSLAYFDARLNDIFHTGYQLHQKVAARSAFSKPCVSVFLRDIDLPTISKA